MGMKGQLFIITAIVVIVALFLIKSTMNLTDLIERKRYLEIGLERQELLNIKDEALNVITYSYKKNETTNIKTYLDYIFSNLAARSTELTGLEVESSYPTVVSGVETRLNVTIYNFLGKTISTLNISFSSDYSANKSFSTIPDGTYINTSFVFTTATTTNYTLIVYYQTTIENKTYNIKIPAEIGKSKFIGFFDLRMKTLRSENSDEVTRAIDLT